MSDILERLRIVFDGDDVVAKNIALRQAYDEIEQLHEKCDKQATILRRINPENFPGIYFITGEAGVKDQNGMPETLYVVPSYGVDFSYVYERKALTVGPEW